jgi:threonine dehydrogenase-like Zn-dependent dehydrogenase
VRAVRCTEDGIRVVDVAAPAGEGVRVRPRAVSICQTDLNMLRYGPRPITFGHEFAGVTDDGTPVAIEPLVPCGACAQCATGDTQWCDENYRRIAGVGFDGGMADEIIVPERCLVPLPATLPVGDASLCEPLAVNLHSLALARLDGRMRVVVCGAGRTGFGLLGAVGALWRGCTVDVVDEHAHLLAAAERLGAGTTATGTYDLVIEGDGSEASIARAAELCRPGGTVLLVAGYYDDKMFRVLPFVVKELTVVWGTFYGHHAAGRAFDNAAMLLAQRPDVARTLITHRVPLDAAADAFAIAAGPEPSIKVVVEP